MEKTSEITYLASVYFSPDWKVKEHRYNLACQACNFLIRDENIMVFSPIVHWHHISVRFGIPGDYQTWKEYNGRMIELLSSFTILLTNDWEESKGGADELEYAQLLGKPIKTLKHLKNNKFKLLD